MDVSHEGLAAKAQEFKDKGIPVRWMLIDDMWAESNNNLATMHSRELRQFEGDPQRFPGGMRAAISELKEKFGMKVGVWHPTTSAIGTESTLTALSLKSIEICSLSRSTAN